jgi:hypothetical protein
MLVGINSICAYRGFEGVSLMGKERTFGERRKFNRFVVKIPVQCKPVSPGRKRTGRESVCATIKNISSNGILLKWSGGYRLPQFLRLGISVIPTSKPIESIARTVWTKERKSRGRGKRGALEQYDMGLSFVQNEHSKVPRLISRETNFYWEIFERTGHIQAYLLHKGIDKEWEEVSKDG